MSERIPYSMDLSQKPDITNLIASRQMSKLQLEIAQSLIDAGLDVSQEVLIYNEKHPQNPFRIDIVVHCKDVAIEIDGVAYHNSEKNKERDQRKKEMIFKHGYSKLLRIPYEIPKKYIYHLDKGAEREEKKAKYEKWRADFIRLITEKIVSYKDHQDKLKELKSKQLPPESF